MVTTLENDGVQILRIEKEVVIEAPVEIAFESILLELGPEGEMMDGKPFPRVLEAWPGGRWYRDLGAGTGHFWGHVQVIKPPLLIELCGPLFMSYAAANHLMYRLQAIGDHTKLSLTHTAWGLIAEDHRKGVHAGWEYSLSRVAQIAKRRLVAK